jgi:polyhydroxyalkanoate synthesis regulator phasin
MASFREEAEQRIDKLLRRDEDGSDLIKSSQKALEEWQRRMDERVKTVVEGVLGNLPALGRDLQTLLNRLEQLEKKVDALEREKKR